MRILFLILLITGLVIVAPVQGDPLNPRQGYPLPIPWEIGRLKSQGEVAVLELSSDGKALYGLGWNNETMAWDLTTGQGIPLPSNETAKLNFLLAQKNRGRPPVQSTEHEPIFENEPFYSNPRIHDDHRGYQEMDDRSVQIQDLDKRPAPNRWQARSYSRVFAIDLATGNLASGDLIAWDVKTGAVLGDQSKFESYGGYSTEGVLWQDGHPFGLVKIRTPIPRTTAQNPYPMPTDFDQLGKMDLESGKIVAKTPVISPARFWTSRSGHFVAIGYQSQSVGLRASAIAKTPSTVTPMDYEPRPSLQILDADLVPVGSGLIMLQDSGTCDVAISPGDQLIGCVSPAGYSSTGAKLVQVFDLKTEKPLLPDPLKIESLSSIATSDTGYLFTATNYGSVAAYSVSSGRKVSEVETAHRRQIISMAVSPDNKILATAAQDDLIKLWSIPGLKPMGFLDAPNAEQQPTFGGLGFYDNNTVLDLTRETNELRLLPVSEAIDYTTWNVDSSESESLCLAISTDGKQIAIGQENGILTVVDNTTGTRLFHIAASPGGVREIKYGAGSYRLTTLGENGKLLTWDLSTSPNPISETNAQGSTPHTAFHPSFMARFHPITRRTSAACASCQETKSWSWHLSITFTCMTLRLSGWSGDIRPHRKPVVWYMIPYIINSFPHTSTELRDAGRFLTRF